MENSVPSEEYHVYLRRKGPYYAKYDIGGRRYQPFWVGHHKIQIYDERDEPHDAAHFHYLYKITKICSVEITPKYEHDTFPKIIAPKKDNTKKIREAKSFLKGDFKKNYLGSLNEKSLVSFMAKTEYSGRFFHTFKKDKRRNYVMWIELIDLWNLLNPGYLEVLPECEYFTELMMLGKGYR